MRSQQEMLKINRG